MCKGRHCGLLGGAGDMCMVTGIESIHMSAAVFLAGRMWEDSLLSGILSQGSHQKCRDIFAHKMIHCGAKENKSQPLKGRCLSYGGASAEQGGPGVSQGKRLWLEVFGSSQPTITRLY